MSAKSVQCKVIGNDVVLIETHTYTGDGQEVKFAMSGEAARKLVLSGALRNAAAEAIANAKENRRQEIERLEQRVRELKELDRPIPDDNAPTIRGAFIR